MSVYVPCGVCRPGCLKLSVLHGPQDALGGAELVDHPPPVTTRNHVLAHHARIGQQPQQAHLRYPAQREVIFLLVKPIGRGAMVDMPTPCRREPDADVEEDHRPAYLSMSSASSAASMSAFVTFTLGVASRPTSGKVTRPERAGRAGMRSSRATARVTR